MASKSVLIVDDLVTALTAGSYTQTIVVTKELVQRTDRAALTGIEVTVSSGLESWEKASRGGVYIKTYEARVVITTAAATDSAVDLYIELSEEIKEDLATQAMSSLACVGIEQDEPYDIDRLYDAGSLFVAMITFQYRG
jgi:hypothetical protein